ncbi:hypothetical protein QUG33_23925 [Citrobacter braakii]|uniref:hypothetical protein n=1 Tax=Citrobacter braakii TaxID=57706 RepID=UPI0025A2EB35|nr:hypothetical protein [Citrobacter braakii]MDM6732441.1 hypothetical protein [Citrobacter braakii]
MVLNCKGVELFLNGSEGIKNIDNATIVKENQIYKLLDPIDSDYNFSYEAYLRSICPKKEHFAKRILRLVTFNGNLLPSIFLKKNIIVPTVTASMRSVFGYRNIIHYNAEEHKIYVTKNSKIEFLGAIWNISKISIKILLNYRKIKIDYLANFSQLTAIESWEEKFKQSDRK